MTIRALTFATAMLFAGSVQASVFKYDFTVDFHAEPSQSMPARSISSSFTLDHNQLGDLTAPIKIFDVSAPEEFTGHSSLSGRWGTQERLDMIFRTWSETASFFAVLFIFPERKTAPDGTSVYDVNSPTQASIWDAGYRTENGEVLFSQIARVTITEVVQPIPLPAPLSPLLVSIAGLFGFGWLRRTPAG